MTASGIRIRAREPEDIEAIAEILGCPSVIAGTAQLPFRSVAERRERLTQPSDLVLSLVAEIGGRVVGTLGLHGESTPADGTVAALGSRSTTSSKVRVSAVPSWRQPSMWLTTGWVCVA